MSCNHATDARLGACPRCLLKAELPPAVLSDTLELEEEIGRGGMGSVFRAKHRRLGRTVAVKLLPEELAAQPEFRTRFEREARALAMLNHPNIVAIHDIGQDGEQSYIVMEFVRGRPLSRMMPLPVNQAIEVALQVCDALAYAHKQGVVHRDIKPENILVDDEGRVKVTDFGIARILKPEAHGWTATSSDQIIGTPQYIAPEAMRGAAPDPRMDIYSLGVVLYETVTGHPPVGDFEPPPAAIDAIVRKALAPDLARRYATVEEMRRDLAAVDLKAPVAELRDEEELFIRAVALLQSISTGVAIYAFVESVTPKVLRGDQILPLVTIGRKELPDGMVYTQARFETWWTLAALATFAIAITAYGFLRRHWRLAGLEVRRPDRPVREVKWVLVIGVVACALYGLRLFLDARGFRAAMYIPIAGGLIEVAALYYLWVCILKAWRVARPLRREPLMWLGFALALVPPTANLVMELAHWKP